MGGLLEQSTLLVRTRSPEGRIDLSDGGTVLGFAVRQAPRGLLSWWPVLGVYETFDSPLVFTVRRTGLLPRWEVRDSEGDLIAIVATRRVFDCWGRTLMTRMASGLQGTPVQGGGDVSLAEWGSGPDGLRVAFRDPVQHDPFAKMAILAAVLVWHG
ncbi:MAG: hypothetical protein U0736_11635 [Gemmataceae bacterium]